MNIVNNNDKYRFWLEHAYEIAASSPDPSTQNGSLLVDEDGQPSILFSDFNRFPDGVEYKDDRWERPLKYKFIEHAERNVIYKAAKQGESTFGLTMVCPWAACSDCARSIIQAGVKKLITHKQAHDRSPEFWAKEIEVAFQMFKEAEVQVDMYAGPLEAPAIRHSGEVWNPGG